MSKIIIETFNGLLPRYQHQQTSGAFATEAIDVDLSNGDLRPIRKPKLLKADHYDNAYYCGCEIVPMKNCEMVTSLINDCGFQIKSGVGEATLVCDPCCEDQPLGLPTPETPPQVISSKSTNRKSDARYYSYTYVDCYGRESITSPPSTPISTLDGDVVMVGGFETPNGKYCIDHVNVYRSATGYRSGSEEVQEDQTSLFFVGTVDGTTGTLLDSTLTLNLGKPCVAEDNYPPHKDLRQIQRFERTNQLVGFTGREIHFSTGGKSHIFPIEHQMTVPSEILGIQSCRYNDAVYVFTNEDNYKITGVTCEAGKCANIRPIESPKYVGLKDNKKQMCTPIGTVYVSNQGLVLLHNKGYDILTSEWFSKSDWRKLAIETMRIGYSDDAIHFTSDVKSYVLTIDTRTGGVRGRELVESSHFPTRYMNSPTGELIMFEDGVYQWNAGNEYEEFLWRKQYQSHYKTHYTVCLVDSEGMNKIELSNSNGDTSVVKYGLDNQISRMVRNGKSRRHTVTITGRELTNSLVFASTVREIPYGGSS